MKKTIAILLVLVIGMVGVWAADADPKTLEINTTRAAFNAFKLTSNSYTNGNYYTTFINGAGVLDVVEEVSVANDLTYTAPYLTMATNGSGFTVQVTSAEKLSHSNPTYTSKIDYQIGVAGKMFNTKTSPVEAVDLVTVAVVSTGVQVTSTALVITIDPESYNNAAATTGTEEYSGNVTFTIKSV